MKKIYFFDTFIGEVEDEKTNEFILAHARKFKTPIMFLINNKHLWNLIREKEKNETNEEYYRYLSNNAPEIYENLEKVKEFLGPNFKEFDFYKKMLIDTYVVMNDSSKETGYKRYDFCGLFILSEKMPEKYYRIE